MNDLEEIEISLSVDKEPYIKELSNDKIINLTGQSGSGKTHMPMNILIVMSI